MPSNYEMERFFIIVAFVLLGFSFLINVIFIDMFRALHTRDLVMWSNLYFELCGILALLNVMIFYFYNSLVRQVKL